MKKTFTVLFMILGTLLFAAPKNTKQSIVCTTFPIYDWTRNILEDESNYNLVLLEHSGVDLHSYKPSAKDIINIQGSNLFIYVGGESDEWITETILRKTKNPLKLFELDYTKLDEDEDPLEEEEEEEEEAYDEHIWLSLKNAIVCVEGICDKLISLNPHKADLYKNNANEYIKKLTNLHNEYEAFFNTHKSSIVVCDRFPFKYLAKDYNIEYFAAFKGCSAETEASFKKIAWLTECLNNSNLNCVYTMEKSNNKLPRTVITNSNKKDAQIYSLDSLQSINDKDIANGATYIKAFQNNFKTFQTSIK